jgi:hypothetical protein
MSDWNAKTITEYERQTAGIRIIPVLELTRA